MRYWFLNLHIQHGEYEFYGRSVHQTETDEFDAEEYASTYYWLSKEPDEMDGAYYFNGGEVAVKVQSLIEITEEEYNVLNKYLR